MWLSEFNISNVDNMQSALVSNIDTLDTINPKSSLDDIDSNDNLNTDSDVYPTIEPTPTPIVHATSSIAFPLSTPSLPNFSLSNPAPTRFSISIPLSTLFASLFMIYYIILRIRLWNARMKANVYIGDGTTEMIKRGGE